ncbi:3-dehydroquinate synthase [Salinimicrobium sp. TH3]|uniref:3-dehydroquinate synthase n=1 Tax=Salinimicrobium sp. TH3 TaxID=2997342 RepID=UPI002275ACBB|nr:3-dehydroquinate synthase [Salinimicrobium sp. TH3]MCY2687133.1 3-dehydroquinate synthase [Salinimicrobium sp. TH3]
MTKASAESSVFFTEKGYNKFNRFIEQESFTKIFVLVDSNTHLHCLAPFLQQLETNIPLEILEIDAGEENKTLDTCSSLWDTLSHLGGDRKSLLVNLGGGVVTDLGGFVAAAFKRGIACVHFPTTLLAMVDAALGGKNGVNLGALKNQVGVIKKPEMVVADPSFLGTLPAAEMRSGLAEMLKHGLIADEDYWNRLNSLKELDITDLEDLIKESVVIKEKIVKQDPLEKGLRKSLNFGHTLGHAIESFFLEDLKKQKILHGEAVAAGMVLAAFLSSKLEGFPIHKRDEIRNYIHSMYGRIPVSIEDQEKIIDLLKYDKKNEGGKINFVLLRKIGEPVIDREVPNSLILEAFRFYLALPENE